MTYWYLGHKKPTKKQKKIKEAAEARRKARDDKNKKAVDEVKAKKQKGTLSQDVKDFNAKVDQEAAALEAS